MDDLNDAGMTDRLPRAEDHDENSAVLWLWDSTDLHEILLFHPDLITFDGSADTDGPHPDLRRVIAVAGQTVHGVRDLLLSTAPQGPHQVPDSPNIGLVIANTERVRREFEERCLDRPCIKLDMYEPVQGAVPQASEWKPSAAITYAYIAADCFSGVDSVLRAFGIAFGSDGGAELLIYAREPDLVRSLIGKFNQTCRLGSVRVEIRTTVDYLNEPYNWPFDVLVIDSAPNRIQPAAYEAAIRGREVVAVPLRRQANNLTANLTNGAEVDPENDDDPSADLAAKMFVAARRLTRDRRAADPSAQFARMLAPRRLARRLLWITKGPLSMIQSSDLSGVGWVTRWNVKCGISDHAAHQIASYPGRHIVLAAREEPLLAPDEANVFRCWGPGLETNGLEEAAAVVVRERVANVLIHFNWGFYNPGELVRFISSIRSCGRVAILDMHSTTSPRTEAGLRLADFAACFNACDRVLVHQPADYLRLKSVAPDARVAIEPLGITVRKARAKTTQAAPARIACFGFCLPNKGIEELVLALWLLRQSQHDVRLLLLNAEHPAPDSRQTVNNVRALISKLDLSSAVTFIPEYLDENKCMDLLSNAALIVNPYQQTGESASAAVRFALASMVPVLVTPLPIFDDLGGAVFRAGGTSPAELANAIRAALAELKADSRAAAKVRNAAANWRNVHDLRVQSKRIFGVTENIGINRRAEDWLRVGAC